MEDLNDIVKVVELLRPVLNLIQEEADKEYNRAESNGEYPYKDYIYKRHFELMQEKLITLLS